MSKVILVCGNTASGKSTYSMKIAKEYNAVSFSIDTWMQTLYGADYNPEKHDFAWLLERTERCKKIIRQTAESIIAQNINVVLEIGFGDIKSREYYHKWGSSQGARVYVHYLDVPVETRRERVRKRNSEKGATFSFEVTDEMFDYVEPLFVPPSDIENINLVRITED
ncbi:MAG: ATP-binding protein [Bacillota bacterium]|nr:ATP-binding protein [Bacillota bacterium]